MPGLVNTSQLGSQAAIEGPQPTRVAQVAGSRHQVCRIVGFGKGSGWIRGKSFKHDLAVRQKGKTSCVSHPRANLARFWPCCGQALAKYKSIFDWSVVATSPNVLLFPLGIR